MTNRDIHRQGSGQSDAACDSAYQLLPAYATATALGQHAHTIYPDVAAHLSRCATCRAAFDELRELTIDTYAGAVEPALRYPQPDLSFLPRQTRSANTPQPWRIDQWSRLVIAFSQSLLDSLRPPALLGATRGQLLYTYAVQPQELPGLNVSIEVLAENPWRGLGFVRVNVESLDRDPFEQAPRQVVLRANEAIWEGITDETGSVAFDSVPLAALPYLTIEITIDRS